MSNSSFKKSLVGKPAIVKMHQFSRGISGTVVGVNETGFCFVSKDMVAALREINGVAMASIQSPSVYVPFANLEWLVSSEVVQQSATGDVIRAQVGSHHFR